MAADLEMAEAEADSLCCGACRVVLTDGDGNPLTLETFKGHTCKQCK